VAVIAPPEVDATPALRAIARALRDSHEEVTLVVVLAGARPEDAAEWRRDDFPVAGGALDHPPEESAQAAEIALEHVKRAVERGEHAALVVDALEGLPAGVARRLFASARRAEEGGSLTVVAATGGGLDLVRAATTRIVLEPSPDGGAAMSAASGTTRRELLEG
jgi:transcription termination factor Rho